MADSIWDHNWRPRVLPDMRLVLKYQEKNISFHLRLLSRKTNDKIFEKIQKTLFWCDEAILPFPPKFGQKWIFPEKRLCQFLNIPIIYHYAKNEKKLICHSWVKCETDRWMYRQMEGQIDNRDFVGPSVGWDPIITVTLSFSEFISEHQKPFYSINYFVRCSQF